jgi:hypothetical protein
MNPDEHLPKKPRSAYINPTAELITLRSLKPSQHGWGKGWPDNCPTTSQLASFTVTRLRDGKQFSRPVRKELAPLFGRIFTYTMLLDPEWEIRTKDELGGGFSSIACRPIAGTNKPSNHSQGRAVDVNSAGNPQKENSLFISRQSPILVELAASALTYWGGWYWDPVDRYVDSMHLEFVGRVGDVPRALAGLDVKYEEIRKRLFPEPEDTVSKDQIKAFQTFLNGPPFNSKLVVDGNWGRLSQAAFEKAVTRVPQLLSQLQAAEANAKARDESLVASRTDASEIAALAVRIQNR